jgi:hypothetical protein
MKHHFNNQSARGPAHSFESGTHHQSRRPRYA